MENNETDINYTFDQYHEEEEDEALSLSELPLHNDQTLNDQTPSCSSIGSARRSSSEPQDFFEFFSDFNGGSGDMCSAEDIIFCGRLISTGENPKLEPSPALRRRSESLSELKSASKDELKPSVIMRNSRSLDYQKLRGASNCFSAGAAPAKKSEPSSPAKKAARPRWSAVRVFGVMKIPAEMELGDIKSRQARRSSDAGGNSSVSSGGGGGGATWRLLNALSCKDYTSVAVTACQ